MYQTACQQRAAVQSPCQAAAATAQYNAQVQQYYGAYNQQAQQVAAYRQGAAMQQAANWQQAAALQQSISMRQRMRGMRGSQGQGQVVRHGYWVRHYRHRRRGGGGGMAAGSSSQPSVNINVQGGQSVTNNYNISQKTRGRRWGSSGGPSQNGPSSQGEGSSAPGDGPSGPGGPIMASSGPGAGGEGGGRMGERLRRAGAAMGRGAKAATRGVARATRATARGVARATKATARVVGRAARSVGSASKRAAVAVHTRVKTWNENRRARSLENARLKEEARAMCGGSPCSVRRGMNGSMTVKKKTVIKQKYTVRGTARTSASSASGLTSSATRSTGNSSSRVGGDTGSGSPAGNTPTAKSHMSVDVADDDPKSGSQSRRSSGDNSNETTPRSTAEK
jgi:hypothetical protein